MILLLGIIISYLIGSIPTALIVGKFFNIDIRKHGSGNIGAANTFRVLGKVPGLIVWIGDILKGVIPVLIISQIIKPYANISIINLQILLGSMAILGHVFPIFLQFKGGKAIATSTGVFLGIEPVLMSISILVLFLLLKITKYFSVGTLSSFLSLVILIWIFEKLSFISIFATLVFIFVLILHKSNIKRLIQGKENKMHFSSSSNKEKK
ncbi:MAG: glycerol-3-phosphate 1-O-acyltransferase PlsY [bacterium]